MDNPRHIAEFVASGPDRREEPRPGSFDRRAVARAVRRIRIDPVTAADAVGIDWDEIAHELTGTCGYPIEV